MCVGAPYGTSFWQVGDSAEQNGSFKMAMVRAKVKILQKKANCHLDFAVEKADIVLLVQHAWKESFAIKETNKKAIAERGWGPLNYVLLDHPELANSQQPTSIGLATAYQDLELAGSEPLDPQDLNTSHGMAGLQKSRTGPR